MTYSFDIGKRLILISNGRQKFPDAWRVWIYRKKGK